ncbi:DUF3573 domain-containing protein [Francisellaceae bacterium CB300]
MQVFTNPLICFLIFFSSSLASVSNKKSTTTDELNSIVELQQQIEALQNEIKQIDLNNESSPTLFTYESVINKTNVTLDLKNSISKKNTDMMKNIGYDGNIIDLSKIEERSNIFGNTQIGDGIDVQNAVPITSRGEVTYLGSYSGNNNIPIGMVAGSLFASTLMMQKEKLDDYSIFLGGRLSMNAETWFGDNINRVNYKGDPISSFNGQGQNMYLTSSRLYFVSNLGSYVTAAYDVNTSELQDFFIGNAFVTLGNLTESPFFITAGRSTLPVSTLDGLADFLGTGRATNVSLNYKSDTINTNIAIFASTDSKVDFSTGFFYADSWTEDLSIGFNTGYVYDLSGAENFTIPPIASHNNIGAYNIDANIAYNVGSGTFQINPGWITTTGKDYFKGNDEKVLTGAWYLGLNYSLELAGRGTNFNFNYSETYNANAIPMAIGASLNVDGISETGVEKQLILSTQRAYFDNYALFGAEWNHQQFYDGSHMNTLSLSLSVYM